VNSAVNNGEKFSQKKYHCTNFPVIGRFRLFFIDIAMYKAVRRF
jgi:hypothetical protein